MCGIAGRFHPAQLAPEPSWAARASALLAHRGPDGEGHWEDERCDLVHRRLALIDLSPTGAQPMSNEDGAVLVVYNGEIYNYRALTAELKARGHRFRSTSDTEVLVHLYEDEGERMVARLRGIFAFAIYDRRRGRLFLARDRFGVKPLFFTVQDGEWAFASEMKALLALPGFRPEIDRQACYDFLGLGYIPEPATGFANIQALPRGSCLTISRQGHHLREYEQIAAHPDRGRTLADAVRSEEHTSELQSRLHLVCRLLLEKKKTINQPTVVRRTQYLSLPRAVQSQLDELAHDQVILLVRVQY